MQAVESEVRQFVIDNFLYGEADKCPSNDDSFLEHGVVDSTGILELVAFLEKRFGIEIDESELVPANLDSLNKLVRFVEKKLGVSK